MNHAAESLRVSHRAARWPKASEVQTLLFARPAFTEHRARSWARRHGFAHRKTHVTDAKIRIRQADPSQFSEFRTIALTDGVQAVVGPRR